VAKALKVVSTIAGIASTVLMFVPGGQPFAAAAAAVSAAASVGSTLLQKKPPVLGSPVDVKIGSNNARPYPMGRTYMGPVLVHDVAYGPTTGGVPNPYRSMVGILSGHGPIESIEAFQTDFSTVSFSGGNAVGYYHNYLYLSTQMGACPESAALAGPFGAIPGWGAAYKLSGMAAFLATLKDDKEGKIFSSGVPRLGAVGRGVKVYDQRQDSTYPGGSGACRALDETTYVGGAAAENPSCHGVTYALGRIQNGKRVMGVGLGTEAIDWPAWTEFANVCDANAWKVGGTVYEPGSRWDNLKRICEAGGGRPAFVGGKLTVLFPRPRVALDTIGMADLADAEVSLQIMRGWRERKNTLVPKVRLESHKWELTQLDPVSVADFVTEDGEEKKEEYPLELVQQADQGVELAGYSLWGRREFGPFTLPCKVRLIEYKPGDALELGADLIAEVDPDNVLGLADRLVVITGRRIDPASATVQLTLETETPGKHVAVLGASAGVPPAPTITTGEELDAVAGALLERTASSLISTSFTTDADPADGLLQGTDTSITVEGHTRTYADRTVSVTGATVTGLTPETLYHVYYDDEDRAGGAVTFAATTDPEQAVTKPSQPFRHYVGSLPTDAVGGGGTSGGGSSPPGWNEDYWHGIGP